MLSEMSAKCLPMTLLALIFKSSMYVVKIVKAVRKQKWWLLLYIPHLL